MASNLLETLRKIEQGRQDCIKNARKANLPTDTNMGFPSIAKLFLQKNTEDNISEEDEPQVWERPNDWWDLETILQEADTKTIDGVEYFPVAAILLDDSESETVLDVNAKDYTSSTAGKILTKFDKVAFSDSLDTLHALPITHAWNTTQDKECSLGYSTRYILFYHKSRTLDLVGRGACMNVSTVPSVRELVLHNLHVSKSGGGTSAEPISFSSCYALNRIKFTDSVIINDTANYWYSTIYNCMNLKQLILHGVNYFYMINGMCPGCQGLELFSAPDATTIEGSLFNSSYDGNRLTTVNLPNITSIKNNTNYGVFGRVRRLRKLSLPKLKNITLESTSAKFLDIANNLKVLELPELVGINASENTQGEFITSAYSLKTLLLPKLQTVNVSTFINSAYNLEVLSLPVATTITAAAQLLSNAYGLKILDVGALERYACRYDISAVIPYAFYKRLLDKISFTNTPGTVKFSAYACQEPVIIPESLKDYAIEINSDDTINELVLPQGWNTNITCTYRLNLDTLPTLFESLADVTELGGRTIKLNSDAYSYIPAEVKAIATNKGWTVTK